MIRQIDTLIDSPKLSPKLKEFVLSEFAGEMVSMSVYITQRLCQHEDEWEIARRTDALIAALAPFLHAAIMKDEKVRELTQIITYMTRLVEQVTAGREKLQEEKEVPQNGLSSAVCVRNTWLPSCVPDQKNERELLRRAVARARENGWGGGLDILACMESGWGFDADFVLRGLLDTEYFTEALWPEQTEKHRLGLQLVEDPITYLRLYV